MDMGEAVDLLAGQVGGGRHDIFILRILSEFIGLGHGLHGGTYDGIVLHVFDLPPKHVDLEI